MLAPFLAAAVSYQCTPPGAKPIAIVATNYGNYDRLNIIRNILDHEVWHFEDRGSFLAPSEFENYSMVVIAYEQERPFTAEKQNQVREYLEKTQDTNFASNSH